jgi:hypothetical protein
MLARLATIVIAMLCPAACWCQHVIDESFTSGMENWWSEGGERVWVQDGRLYVKADNPGVPGGTVAAVWCKIPHPADFRLELDAHVVSSSIKANNINLFFSYVDPAGTPLFETRDARRSADYKLYHSLNGYIVTFLNDAAAEGGRNPDGSTKARVRIRRNPGFHLLAEKFADRCLQGTTYHLAVEKRGGMIVFLVDGTEVLRAADPQPLGGGLLGLRTFRTYLWWDNVKLDRQ